MNKARSKGFTLLELLIVVIIIGALASVALPQFGKMVKKARASEAIANIGAILTAEQVLYQEGDFTTTLANVPVDVNSGTNFTYTITTPGAAGATRNCVVAAVGVAGGNYAGISATGTLNNNGTRTTPSMVVA